MKADDPALDVIIADTAQRAALKLRIANAEGSFPFETTSAIEVARRIVADCKDSQGRLHEHELVRSITDVVVLLYKAQGRLPLFRNITTGEVHE